MVARVLFHALVLLVLGLIGAGLVRAVRTPGLLPDQLRDYEGRFTPDQYEGRHGLRTAVLLASASLSAAATWRLLRRRPGAPLYFGSGVGLFVAVELLRPYVHPGAGEDCYEHAIVLTAVVLAALFFTPAKRWYAA